MATEFKNFVNNQITQEKSCFIRYVEERNELRKRVEASQDPINVSDGMPFKTKHSAIIGCLRETQKMDRNRIIMLTALINDIIDGIREKECQVKLLEVNEQVSSDTD
ncbi:hypothetical protein CTI12_AA227940 [Artemisia annua]|uniref:Uncharacterized protein n=1 Tax=Artemisia annua TaxID=35608 RepID=A0A2U1NUD0_ARTAN|nr:hypothetical protein CTI12_AA227940 [Artemisia annua]